MPFFMRPTLTLLVVVVTTLGFCAGANPARGQCQINKITADDGMTDDDFGSAVAIDGECVVVGAPHAVLDSGAAYLYRRAGLYWVPIQELTGGLAEFGDNYGTSVAIDGDVVVIGAPNRDDDGLPDVGAVYVWRRDTVADIWCLEHTILAPDREMYDGFGEAVAIDGSWMVIGCPGDNAVAESAGSAYVYAFDGTTGTWSEAGFLRASDGASADGFGRAVAISGDRIVVGAESDDDGGSSSGSAYVFRFDAVSGWSQTQKLVAVDDDGISDADANDKFGSAVSIDRLRIAVGANGNDSALSNTGSVYVFQKGEAGWAIDKKLDAANAAASDRFGRSVSILGDYLLVGADYTDGAGSSSGSAYVFRHTGSTWVQVAELVANDAEAGDRFGCALALGRDYAAIGAYGDDDSGSSAGAAYVFKVTVGTDCDNNGVADECDIAAGTHSDDNGNGIPDQCECVESEECVDALFCNGVETCVDGACVSSGNPCIELGLVCDEASDSCVACQDDMDCYDGNACTDDVCQEQECVHFFVPSGTDCGFPADPECGVMSTCDGAGLCVPNHLPNGTPCSEDDDQCTDDVCIDGECRHPDSPNGTPCSDDGRECTDDVCTDAVCEHPYLPSGTACGDPSETACDLPDTCDQIGHCMGNYRINGTECESDDNECTDDICYGGECTHPNLWEGTACGDQTRYRVRHGGHLRRRHGVCQPQLRAVTEPPVPTTETNAPTTTAALENAPIRAPLAWGHPVGIPAEDRVQSERDTCDGAGTCLDNWIADGTACVNDFNACTEDFCESGVCIHPAVPSGTACGSPADSRVLRAGHL